MHAKALRMRACWSETFLDVWEESQRTAIAVDVKRGIDVDPDKRTLDPRLSSKH